MRKFTKKESQWQYPVVLLLALGLVAISVNGFICDWGKAGDIGEFFRQLFIITATAIFGAAIIHYLLQAKSMQAIHDALTNPASVLASVSTDEFDRYVLHYIKNNYSLAEEGSRAFWDLIKTKIFSTTEHRLDYKRSITIVDAGDKQGYLTFDIETEYEIKNHKDTKLKFACRLKGSPTDIIHDMKYEKSWIFVPVDGDNQLPEDSFTVELVEIGDAPLPIKVIKKNEEIIIFEAEHNYNTLDGKRIRYKIKVKQAAAYAFVSDHLTQIARDYTIVFDYSKFNKFNGVYAAEFIVASGDSRTIKEPGKIKVNGYGWVLPRGGVVFSWG